MKNKSFLAALFDFSFNDFITLHWIKFIFGLTVLFTGWIPVAGFIFFVTNHEILGFLACCFSVLLFLVVLVFARMSQEALVVVFRIEEHTRRMANRP